MIYRSFPAVVVLGRPPPTFLTAVPVVWNAIQARETTLFVDSELYSYTGDGTPLLQLSDYSSTCEVVEMISSSHISRTDSLALATNMLNCISVVHFILLLSSARQHHAFCVRSRRF
ncbi:hypothetical protein TNCV_561911 [Trichonephila clavipes]|uniref:Uncharacterized protein n=1 Tax=Trichonephila clavipes TaxID=2585209 RepID=A0A8X6VA63_TRICX|nr:hypothetical protein TNCV_561911 [Trichonephila clavipes]